MGIFIFFPLDSLVITSTIPQTDPVCPTPETNMVHLEMMGSKTDPKGISSSLKMGPHFLGETW